MSIELLTVDNDVVTIKDNKVVGKGSRFDGREVKTDADIKEIFGIDVGAKDMKPYMKNQPMQTAQPSPMQQPMNSQMPMGKAKPMNPKSMNQMLKANLMGLI